ncbi:MAG: DUF5696 domain-containing protein [Thermoguttaceae bacterium]|jgi:hypothetical protein
MTLLLVALSTSAWGEEHRGLKWDVDASGKLTVSRSNDAMVWQGERLADITYWDAAGKERSQSVTPDAGWTIDREATDQGSRLTCRQKDLGFVVTLTLSGKGDVLTISTPAAGVAETGEARLKTFRLLPRFGAAAEGEAGYLVIAQQSGALCHFSGKRSAERWLSVYQTICQCPMPLFGLVRGTSGLAGIVTSGQYDARFCVSTNWGSQHQYAIDPGFTLRTLPKETRLADDLTVEYHVLSEAEASWIGVAKRYRQYNFARRGVRPLRERAAASPGLAYSMHAMEVRLRLGVKPVPYKITEQTPETEPPVRVFLDFARVRDVLDEFHRQGITRAEICLVGWNRGGHDGRYPQLFPVEPALGGLAELQGTIRHGQSLGYQMIAHDCCYGAYRISERWDEAYLRRDSKNQLVKGGVWGGGQSYNICLTRAKELFAKPDWPKIHALGFQGGHYSDVLTIIGPRPCYDARHPESRRQDAEAATEMLAHARALFGSSQSEGGLDFAAPGLDRFLYLDCDKWMPLLKQPHVDTCVPLYETVYHGVLLYNLSTGVINTLPGETGYLRGIEYGSLPLACFYGHFLLDESKNWMGSRDYRYDDREGLQQAVAGLRRVFDDIERLKHLQTEFIEGHRPLDEGVFETVYSNGQRVVVNYRDEAYPLATGQRVSARSYLLLPCCPKSTGL